MSAKGELQKPTKCGEKQKESWSQKYDYDCFLQLVNFFYDYFEGTDFTETNCISVIQKQTEASD